MDPQHRMLLEITYEAMENGKNVVFCTAYTLLTSRSAGIPTESVVGSDMACYVGGFTRGTVYTCRHAVNGY